MSVSKCTGQWGVREVFVCAWSERIDCWCFLKHGHSAQSSHVEQFTAALLQMNQPSRATDWQLKKEAGKETDTDSERIVHLEVD